MIPVAITDPSPEPLSRVAEASEFDPTLINEPPLAQRGLLRTKRKLPDYHLKQESNQQI